MIVRDLLVVELIVCIILRRKGLLMRRKITLLYAEDEVETRQNHLEYLKDRYDFHYLEASDGVEALTLFKKYQPEIILTDITMPHMDGLTFIEQVRENSPHTKVVVMTAYDEHEKLMKAFGLDIVNYLIKPINRKKLSAAVDLALETLPSCNKEGYICRIDANTRWDNQQKELYRYGEIIALSQLEKRLISLLCSYKNSEVSSNDIYFHVWQEFSNEFSADSVRTLVKNLRKKLPDAVLLNSYGGFYKLV